MLLDSEDTRVDRGPITVEWWLGLDLATAYRVHDEIVRCKVESGQHIVGIKLGLTSRAKKQHRWGLKLAPGLGWTTSTQTLCQLMFLM